MPNVPPAAIEPSDCALSHLIICARVELSPKVWPCQYTHATTIKHAVAKSMFSGESLDLPIALSIWSLFQLLIIVKLISGWSLSFADSARNNSS